MFFNRDLLLHVYYDTLKMSIKSALFKLIGDKKGPPHNLS